MSLIVRAIRFSRYDTGWLLAAWPALIAFLIYTGPLTFAMGDQDFGGKSPEEIYAAYAGWYDKENIRGMIEAESERPDAV